MNNPKKCKGTGKAIGSGCGKMTPFRKYGLCFDCYRVWLYETDEGRALLSKSAIRAKKAVKKQKRQETREEKERLRNKSYYEKQLQSEINEIVRIIDTGKGCISCFHGWGGEFTRKKNAGHFYSVGSCPEMRFNVNNIYLQCELCNCHLHGNLDNYKKGLIGHYSQIVFDRLEKSKQEQKALKLSIEELRTLVFQIDLMLADTPEQLFATEEAK